MDQFSKKIAKCINLAQATLERSGTPYVMSPTAYHQPEHVIGYLDRVHDSLLECINIAESTLGKDRASSTAKHRITRLHYPLSDDLLCQVDRVDDSLLECLNLAEKTMNAKEHEAPEAKFNKDFDDFMGGLKPLDSEPIQINPEFLDPNNNREFINYLNNLETPDEFDDLEERSDDIDLFMEDLLNLNKIEELWHT